MLDATAAAAGATVLAQQRLLLRLHTKQQHTTRATAGCIVDTTVAAAAARANEHASHRANLQTTEIICRKETVIKSPHEMTSPLFEKYLLTLTRLHTAESTRLHLQHR